MATICVIYHSDTGNTEALAKLVAEGAGSVAGVEAQLVRAGGMDLDAAAAADGYAIGSPDYFSYDRLLSDERFHGKPCVCFGTHGGGAKVLAVVESLAKSCKLEQAAPGMMTKGKPGGDDADKARGLGKAVAQAVVG